MGLKNCCTKPIISWSSAIRVWFGRRRRARHKSDKRDAELIFELLCENKFPELWRRPQESANILEILKLRLGLVNQRTQIGNRLQALAHNARIAERQNQNQSFSSVNQALRSWCAFRSLNAVNYLLRWRIWTNKLMSLKFGYAKKLKLTKKRNFWWPNCRWCRIFKFFAGCSHFGRCFTFYQIEQTNRRFCRTWSVGKIQRRQSQIRFNQ